MKQNLYRIIHRSGTSLRRVSSIIFRFLQKARLPRLKKSYRGPVLMVAAGVVAALVLVLVIGRNPPEKPIPAPPPEAFVNKRETPNYTAYSAMTDPQYGYGIMLTQGEYVVAFTDIHAPRIDPGWESGGTTPATPSMQDRPDGTKALVYETVFPGTDIVYTLDPGGIVQEIRINGRESVVESYAVRVAVSGLTPYAKGSGVWYFRDGQKTDIMRLSKGYVTDGAKRFSNDVDMQIIGSTLRLVLPVAWMTAPEREFPLVVRTGLEVVPNLRSIH